MSPHWNRESEKFNYFVIPKEKRISTKLNFFTGKSRKQTKRTVKENGRWMNFSFHLAISPQSCSLNRTGRCLFALCYIKSYELRSYNLNQSLYTLCLRSLLSAESCLCNFVEKLTFIVSGLECSWVKWSLHDTIVHNSVYLIHFYSETFASNFRCISLLKIFKLQLKLHK